MNVLDRLLHRGDDSIALRRGDLAKKHQRQMRLLRVDEFKRPSFAAWLYVRRYGGQAL